MRTSLRATTYDGKVVQIKRKLRAGTARKARYEYTLSIFYTHIIQISSAPTRMSNLLDVPVYRLKDELSAATISKVSLSYVSYDSILEHMFMFSRRKSTATVSQTEKISDLAPEDTLWVDRYRPRKFTELLGNERVARETIAWVKQWDWCVFGNRKSKKRLREDDENYNPNDEYHRPREKVIPLQCNTMCSFIMTFD